MTNLKPFDLEAARAGSPVCTRDGRKAKYILRLNTPDSRRYVFKITEENDAENIVCYDCEGQNELNRIINETHYSDLFMATPEIPEGFTPYDPNVPPPDMADEIEFITLSGDVLQGTTREQATRDGIWDGCRVKCWRVTKWRLPEGVHQHFGWERPEEAKGRGTVWFLNGTTEKKDDLSFFRFDRSHFEDINLAPYRIIGWQRDDEVKKDALEEAITSLTMDICATDVFAQKLRAFAKAIIEEARK